MRIREAFLECLAKKRVSKITVKEICDMAEINRATFYKHYADPFELLQKIEAARISELFYNAYRPRLAQNLPGCTEAEADIAYLFISGGCGHLISSWIKEGMQMPPEEVTDRLGEICDTFLKAYYKTLVLRAEGRGR